MNNLLHSKATLLPIDDYESELAHFISMLRDRSCVADVSLDADRGFSVSARNGCVESLEHYQSSQLSLTLYEGGKRASVSTTDLSETTLMELIERAQDMVKNAEDDPAHGLPDAEEFSNALPELDLYHCWSVSPDEAVRLAEEADQFGIDADPRIVQSQGTHLSTSQRICCYANTRGVLQSYRAGVHSLSLSLVAEDKNGMQAAYDYAVSRVPSQLLTGVDLAQRVSQDVLRRLSPKRIGTQRCPVIFNALLARGLLRQLLRALSGNNIDRQLSFLYQSMGDLVLPERYSLVQQPHTPQTMGASPFDDEGVATRPCCYVDQGRIVEWVLNSYSARRLKRQTTGNAGGVFHLEMPHDNLSFDALLKKMDRGILLTDLMGRGANLQNGDYSRGAFGFWVEGGEIQYPIENFTVAGKLQDMFAHLVAVSDDVDRRGSLLTGSWLLEEMMIAGIEDASTA